MRAPVHPLDALTAAELHQVKEILAADGKLGPKARVHTVDLDEPDKATVTAWRPGMALPRRAIAVVSEAGAVHEAAVDLAAGRVTGWQAVTGEPALLFEELNGMAARLALSDQRMVQGLAKRGFKPDQVFCLPLTAGNFGSKEEQGRRLLKVPCVGKPTGSNYWARPIEGLFATVDLKTRKVLDVSDTGAVPVSDGDQGLQRGRRLPRAARCGRKPNRPVWRSPAATISPIEDGRIVWDMWRFHLRADKRPGPVLSMVEARDGARWRSVAYQMHLSEVFVPYMDADKAWYFRTYMDSGEYGFGNSLSPLRKGIDCPSYARFFPVTLPQDDGEPIQTPDAICVFERAIGDPAWRHFEIFEQSARTMVPADGRPGERTRGALGLGGRQLRLPGRLCLPSGRQHPHRRRRHRPRCHQGRRQPIDEGCDGRGRHAARGR